MTTPCTNGLANDLRRLVSGDVSVLDSELDAVATDYGRIVHRRPRVVVRPRDSAEVAAIIGYARRGGVTIATRAAGHSQGGQALGESIVLDVRGLSANVAVEVDGGGGCFAAGAGTPWRDVLAATIPHGLIPPVLTTNHSTTVGGTHSVGGVGHSSFRFGTQADNCAGFEIVTGAGEVVWCDAGSNDELFTHALCALGQLGVITRIRHRLRRFARFTRIYELAYRDLARLFADADRVLAADRATYVHARAAAIKDRWIHVLAVTIESDHPMSSGGDDEFLAGMGHVHVLSRVDIPYVELLRRMSNDATSPNRTAGNVVRPGIDVILPASAGGGFIAGVLSTIPRWMRGQVLPLVQFLTRSTLTRPMFMTPPVESLVMLSLLPSVSPDDAGKVLGLLTDISAECIRAGGKHYLAGWIPFDEQGWREHFGARWPDLVRLRRAHDANGVFSDGVVPCETVAASFRAVQPTNRDPSLLVAPGFAHDAAARDSNYHNSLSQRVLITTRDAE